MFRIEFSCVFRKPRREVLCLTAIVRPRFQRTSPASERLAGRRSGRLGRPTIRRHRGRQDRRGSAGGTPARPWTGRARSEEHTSELQSLMRISYAVFCLKKKNKHTTSTDNNCD